MKVSARELKNRTGSVLKQVRAGKPVVITFRGRAIARVTSLELKDEEELKEGFGIWSDYNDTKDVKALMKRLRGSRFA